MCSDAGAGCFKADVATQDVGTKGIGFDKRGSFVVAACSALGIELLLDGRLFLDVIGRDNLLVELLLLIGELIARSRCVVCAGTDSGAAHEPRPDKR